MAMATPICLGLSWPLTKQIANPLGGGVAIRPRNPDVDHRIVWELVLIYLHLP